MDYTQISFPGLGIGAVEIPTCAFSIGNFRVSWSLLIVAVGIVLAYWYVACRAKRAEAFSRPRMLLVFALAVACGVIFARGAYVLSTLKTVEYNGFYDVVAFWKGGMSFDAGVLGGVIGVMLASDLLRRKGSRVLDAVVGGALLLQIIASAAAFLAPVETVAIGNVSSFYLFATPIEFTVSDGGVFNLIRMEVVGAGAAVAYHPLFLYRLVWNLIAFLAVHFTYKKRVFSGHTSLIYFAFLGLGMTLQGAILPMTRGWNWTQCFGILMFAAAMIALAVYKRRVRTFSVEVTGTLIKRLSFVRKMNAEERAAKREADKAEMQMLLEEKAEERFAELEGNH